VFDGRAVATAAPGRVMQFHEAEGRLAYGLSGRAIRLWNVAGGETRKINIPGLLAWAAMSPDGRYLATVHHGYVSVWDLAGGGPAPAVATIKHAACGFVAFDPDGQSLLTAGAEGLLRHPIHIQSGGGIQVSPPVGFEEPSGFGDEVSRTLDSLRIGLRPNLPPRPRDRVTGVGLSGDGRKAVVAPTGAGRATVLSAGHPSRVVHLKGHPGVSWAALSPDGRWAATGTSRLRGTGVKVWDALTGRQLADLPTESGGAVVAFSPEGRWLATCEVTRVRVWETGTWRLHHTFPREEDYAKPIVFSPDGRLLAIPYTRSETWLVDPASGREIARLPTTGGPWCFSHDGGTLVTEAEGGAVQLWDLKRIREQLAAMGLDWK
jgi:WD40 repeat protein